MEIRIREFEIQDKEACLIAFDSNVPLFFTKNEVNDFSHFLDTFQNKPIANKTYFYAVILENEVIGCGGFGDKENVGIVSLAWGLIHKDFHNKGFGEQLLKYRLERIERIYSMKSVFVDTTQHTYGFFEKYGFVVSKITDNYYEKGMHRYEMEFKPKYRNS
ncbi:MAG: GNAT family N-acetyltransferase [Bacteroidetes bacterium]|nr:GNAT family N-acetyltransferase [Bacteroidota bacterium]